MQKSLYQTADAGDTLSEADAEVSLSDIECRRHSIRQRMQETLYQPADAGVSLSDSGCRRHSVRQRMKETLYHPADAGVSLSDSRCRRHSKLPPEFFCQTSFWQNDLVLLVDIES